MAKLTFTINDFSGGTNGYVDPLDIADNELAQCQGFKAEPGVVSVLGDMKAAYTIGTGDTAASGNIDVESGHGLFTFSHDYNMAGGATDAGTDLALSNTDYFIMMSRLAADSHNKIDVYDTALHTWRTDMIDLGGSLSDNRMASIKPCFFIADGTVRISPGNFTSVDSGGDLFAGATGDFIADTNPGGFELVVTDAGFDADIAPGDTIIIGKTSADAPGQEMVALITADQALTAARNMTGSFPSALDVTTSNDDVYVIPDTRWRGVVKRKNFTQSGTLGTFTEWYSTYAHPRPPVTWHADLDMGTISTQYTLPFLVAATSGDITVDGTISPTLSVGYLNTTEHLDASWSGASITLWVTALYDEVKQESQPNKITSSAFAVAVQDELAISVCLNFADSSVSSGAYLLNKRVTGARIYYEDETNDPGTLFQLIEIDFEKGCKKADAETFTPWNSAVANEVVRSHAAAQTASSRTTAGGHCFVFINPPKAFTYEINTLYPPDVNTHARYKTAAVINRRAFIGNVYQSGKANGDRMISSPINKFDIFPEYGDFVIDVTQGDGDEIVKLEAYADRILQFKKRTLYIINVGGALGEEFLESQHRNMGVENPSQTCMTEYGVAWVNSHGVFLYDGQNITDLTREKLQITNTTDRPRALNVTESNVPLIGYHPDNKWLVVQANSLGQVTGTTFAAVDSNPDTITDSGDGFVTAGFEAGDTITVTGSSAGGNNTEHVIDSVAAGTLTLSSDSSLTADGAGDTWVIKNNTAAETWVHDFKNGSWTYSQEFSDIADYKSNMIWTPDNNLVFAAGTNSSNNPDFFKYRTPAANMSQDKLLFLTKEFNLNAPGVKKKLRSIYITFSASANSYIEADILYKHPTGTSTDDLEEAGSGSTYYTEALGFKSTSGAVRTVELVPTTYVTNAYTFQLKLHNDDAAYPYGADFKLYNVAFVYRPLGTR